MTVRKGLGQANILRTNNNTSTGYYSAHDGYSELFWDSMEDGIPTGGFFGTSPYKEKYANLLKVVIQLTAIRYSDLPQSSRYCFNFERIVS